MSNAIDIHQKGIWAVLNPQGELVPQTVDETGYGARAAMVRDHNLVWSKRQEQGYSLVRLVPQVVSDLPALREFKGVTGADFSFKRPGFGASRSAVTADDVAARTIEAVELALVSVGFDITDVSIRDALQTALDAMQNEEA